MIELKTNIIGERLKQLREKKGLSLEKLADELMERYGNGETKTPISLDSLKAYEVSDENHSKYGNQKGMGLKNLIMLANYYDVSLDYLLGVEEETSHDMNYICKETKLKENTISELQKVPAFAHIVDYIAKGLLPYMSITDISGLFSAIENYISNSSNNRELALNMLEIQERFTTIRLKVNEKVDIPHKRLF